MINSPCKNCIERGFSCHAHCRLYAEYKRQKKQISEAEKLYGLIIADSYAKEKSYAKVLLKRKHGRRCKNSGL